MIELRLFFIPTYLLMAVHAVPTINQRWDLDGNGTPDFCYSDAGGAAHCMRPDGSWTSLSPSSAVSMSTILSIQSVSSEPSMPDTVTANQNSALPTGNLPDLATFKARMAPNGRSNTLEI